jgi:hypothetical protein
MIRSRGGEILEKEYSFYHYMIQRVIVGACWIKGATGRITGQAFQLFLRRARKTLVSTIPSKLVKQMPDLSNYTNSVAIDKFCQKRGQED